MQLLLVLCTILRTPLVFGYPKYDILNTAVTHTRARARARTMWLSKYPYHL